MERGFMGSGEALAKEQVPNDPVTEPKRCQNTLGPLAIFPHHTATSFLKPL